MACQFSCLVLMKLISVSMVKIGYKPQNYAVTISYTKMEGQPEGYIPSGPLCLYVIVQ